MLGKIFPIIKREFMTRVKTKGFIIGTAILPLLMVVLLVVPVLLSTLKSEKKQDFVIIDYSNRVFEPLTEALTDTTEEGEELYNLKEENMDMKDLEPVTKELKKKILSDEITGYMIIPKDVIQSSGERKEIEFYAKNVSNFNLMRSLEGAVSGVVRTIRLEDSGLDPTLITQLTRRISLETYKISSSGEENKDEGFTFGITYVLVMILYMANLLYGAAITRSVVEEKNTRVVEMIVSSVRPFQLMTGKILGVAAVGLLQFLIWGAFMLLVSAFRMQVGQMFGANPADLMGLPSLPLSVIVFFVLFFVLGFLFFATMFAAVGAMVNSDQEAQQMQMPVIIFLIVPILIMVFIISNPDSTVAFVLSMIPFFSPIIMFMRVAVLMPPAWEVALSIFILIMSIIGMIWIVSKIYRVGILMYGKRPSLPELIKWVRYS